MVLLIAPLPPPVGGISEWTVRILHHARICGTVHLIQLNSAIRYRTVTESSMIMLLVGGVPFVLRHFRNFGLLKLKVFVDEEVEFE